MTREERDQLHKALYSRALREITEGSMKEAQIAVELMSREGMGEDSATEVLAALLGDNGIPDET